MAKRCTTHSPFLTSGKTRASVRYGSFLDIPKGSTRYASTKRPSRSRAQPGDGNANGGKARGPREGRLDQNRVIWARRPQESVFRAGLGGFPPEKNAVRGSGRRSPSVLIIDSVVQVGLGGNPLADAWKVLLSRDMLCLVPTVDEQNSATPGRPSEMKNRTNLPKQPECQLIGQSQKTKKLL